MELLLKNVSEEHWRSWVNFVNDNFEVKFMIYEGEIVSAKIDFTRILNFWSGDLASGAMASIMVGRTIVNTFFFRNDEIDNDITPNEFLSIEDHNILMDYLTSISLILRKKVIVTPERMSEDILISVENGSVSIL